MKVEIVSTGTELLLGEILNTNFQYLSEQMNQLGFDVLYETTVGDNWARMKEVLLNAQKRADIVVTIGGLGPTQGDITKEVTADITQKELVLDDYSKTKIENFFERRKITMPESNIKQAMIPVGGIALENERGTAPGIWLENADTLFVNLPGPPHELKYMFDKKLKPLLLEKFGNQGVIHSKVLRSMGLGESTVADRLYDLIKNQTNPTIAIYARKGEILIRLTAKAQNIAEAEQLIESIEDEVRSKIANIYATDNEILPVTLGNILKEKNLTIALAESCTGGLASSMLTDIAGSSVYFLGSVVSYSNSAKEHLVNVDPAMIEKFGAVSDVVAQQMAEGAAKTFSADIGVGITGIAGPDGGSEEKPVGTVYISVFIDGKNHTQLCSFTGDRENNKLRSAKTALYNVLELLRN